MLSDIDESESRPEKKFTRESRERSAKDVRNDGYATLKKGMNIVDKFIFSCHFYSLFECVPIIGASAAALALQFSEEDETIARKPSSRNADSAEAKPNGGLSKLLQDTSLGGKDVSASGKAKTVDTPDGHLTSLVLKFTTLSEANTEAPSFTVGINGARIGQSKDNEVSVPSDTKLAKVAHASIEFYNGSFYLVDRGYECPASVRIGVGIHKRQWVMAPDACFSAGNSAFKSCGLNSEGNLMLEIVDGPLKGERRVVTKKGATIGRSSDNVLSVPDRELSRRHSKVDYDEKNGRFFVCDIGSTNGTYMQLVGPYNGRYKLGLNDHILVGRTGFSLNRYDFGVSEERGFRQTMEDTNVVIQHLNIGALSAHKMFCPQSFFGVFDGHGGDQASHYLSQKLHVNVATAISNASSDLIQSVGDESARSNSSREGRRSFGVASDEVVIRCLKESFAKTDADFINNSKDAQHGSTATTCIVLGQRLYCANVGDSRTVLCRYVGVLHYCTLTGDCVFTLLLLLLFVVFFRCRNFTAQAMSVDHKPGREDESKRIRDAGGFVINNRVMGELAVSRAFGDSEFKKGIQSIIGQDELLKSENAGGEEDKNWDQPLVIAEPDIQTVSLTENDQFVLLACDGLYDVFTNEEVVSFVLAQMTEHADSLRCCQVC